MSFRGHDVGNNTLNLGNFVEILHVIAESNPSLKEKLNKRYGHYTGP